MFVTVIVVVVVVVAVVSSRCRSVVFVGLVVGVVDLSAIRVSLPC